VPVVAVCLKWAPIRAEVDPLTGAASTDERFSGVSPADRAALEWALRLADARGAEVVAVTAGPAASEPALRDALAAGAIRAVRVALDPDAPSEQVAAALAAAVGGVEVVCCGDHSLDRGSGSVPAFLAAERGAAQALGLLEVDGELRATRRLDQGRRELLSVPTPAVLSFEGGLELRRAPLPRVLAARTAPIEVRPAPAGLVPHTVTEVERGPYRPRARALPSPTGDARQRVLSLTGSLVERTPPQLLELPPDEAAAAIVEQLRTWGHRDPPGR
jgi:electron transfer flavoprotein beta subunit